VLESPQSLSIIWLSLDQHNTSFVSLILFVHNDFQKSTGRLSLYESCKNDTNIKSFQIIIMFAFI